MLLVLLGLGVCSTARGSQPNILFLFADEMDGRILDPNSTQVHPPLPNLLRLAASGAVFTTAYSQSPQCVPSRSAMMAGLRTDQIKVYDNFLGMISTNGDPTTPDPHCVHTYGTEVCVEYAKLQQSPPTFIDRLDEAGYNISLFGKMHVGGGLTRFAGSIQEFPFSHSGSKVWREWSRGLGPTTNIKGVSQNHPGVNVPDNVNFPAGQYDYDAIENCVHALRHGLFNNPSKAQFLYCSIVVPHPPYKSNRTYMDQVSNLTIGVPAWVPKSKFHPNDYATSMLKGLYDIDSANKTTIEHFRRVYFSMCYESDTLLGQVIDELDTSGARDNSFVIMISDHGEDCLEHRQLGKNNMYDAASRVAMIVSGPKIRAGQVLDTLTSLNDVFPTVLDMSNTQIPDGLAGSSLLPLLQADTSSNTSATTLTSRKDYIIAQYHSVFSVTGTFMVRQGDFKLIVFGANQFDQDFPPQLFDLKKDPWELDDISANNKDVVNRLNMLITSELNVSAIDMEAKDLQRALFKAYTFNGSAACAPFFQKLYGPTFDQDDAKKVEIWLGEPCPM